MGIEPWGLYPPEINAGRYVTGFGAPTWIANLIQWPVLAAAVAEASVALGAQVGALTGNWQGASSGKFGPATAPFAAWLGHMQQYSLTQAGSALQVLQSYGAGMAAMVPLPIIIANRIAARTAQVASFVGAPNTEAVRLEIEYAMYWAHNAAVMTAYDISVTTATAPKPVSPPPPLVVGGLPGAGAAANAAATNAGQASSIARAAQSMMNQGTNTVSQAFPSLAGPGTGQTDLWSSMLGGGPGADLAGSGSFGGGAGGGGAGGGGLGGGIAPVAAPVMSMAKPGPVSGSTSLQFPGVTNSPTVTRPPMPMMPPMQHGARRAAAANTGSAAEPVVATFQQFTPTIPTGVIASPETGSENVSKPTV